MLTLSFVRNPVHANLGSPQMTRSSVAPSCYWPRANPTATPDHDCGFGFRFVWSSGTPLDHPALHHQRARERWTQADRQICGRRRKSPRHAGTCIAFLGRETMRRRARCMPSPKRLAYGQQPYGDPERTACRRSPPAASHSSWPMIASAPPTRGHACRGPDCVSGGRDGSVPHTAWSSARLCVRGNSACTQHEASTPCKR